MNVVARRCALLAAAILCAVSMAGCLQTTPVVATASGKPEITLRGSVAKNATAMIVSEMINDPAFSRDFRPIGRTETSATFERYIKGAGGTASPDQWLRIHFDALELGDSTRILGSYTRKIGASSPDSYEFGYRDLQAWLNRLKTKMQP